MTRPFLSVLCALAIAVMAWGADAQPTPQTAPTPDSPQNTVNKRAQADADHARAKAACNERPASEQDACLRSADEAYEKALRE